jgi:hypothetical protein
MRSADRQRHHCCTIPCWNAIKPQQPECDPSAAENLPGRRQHIHILGRYTFRDRGQPTLMFSSQIFQPRRLLISRRSKNFKGLSLESHLADTWQRERDKGIDQSMGNQRL